MNPKERACVFGRGAQRLLFTGIFCRVPWQAQPPPSSARSTMFVAHNIGDSSQAPLGTTWCLCPCWGRLVPSHAAPSGAWLWWRSCGTINMALLTELSRRARKTRLRAARAALGLTAVKGPLPKRPPRFNVLTLQRFNGSTLTLQRPTFPCPPPKLT